MNENIRMKIDKTMNFLKKILENIIFIFFIIIILSGAAQVVGRQVFHKSFIWSEELCRYAGIWVIMLGTAILFGSDEHISLDYFLLKFPKPVQKIIMFVNYLVMIFTMGWFAHYTIVMIEKTGKTLSPALGIPMGIVYLCLVLCGGLSVIFIVYSAIKYYFYPQTDEGKGGGQ